MHPDTFKQLTRIFDLVHSGKLPESAVERVAYTGHQLLYAHAPEVAAWKCVLCDYEWIGAGKCSCDTPEIYQTNHVRTAHWQCTGCRFRWDSEEGDKCQKCGKCHHVWSYMKAECALCGQDKDDYMEALPPGRRPGAWVPGYYKAKVARGETPA